MSNRSETFGRLLKGAINSIATYEGRTAPVIEEELAAKVNLAGSAIQRYKAGYLPPEARTIEIIAEAAVRRGFLSREWLQRFLHAARYHQADKLLDSLCPIGPARPRPPRVYQNLPAPTYSQFVMRQEAFAEILDGLGKRSAAVIIVGLGGNGKTSLAREIADHCLKGEQGQALFDAAVWVSDKDRPGTTNLSVVLDEIARTLDYPGFTQFEHDEKRREVEQLLRRQRVLVCIDNFETITDGALLSWLLNLPEPSKALITTREYRREYRRGGWPVELRGMSDSEARALIDERLKVLRIEKLVSDLAQIEPLVAATGGNPKAIEMTLGLVKYERRPLHQVVDDLYAARIDLFDDLFARAWALLDEAARRVLLIATFFPTHASSEALSASADVQGFALDRSLERLADLALLDAQQVDLGSPARYVLHPLVRAFASAKLAEQPGFEEGARKRWVSYFHTFVHRSDADKWNFPQEFMAIEQEFDTIESVMLFCYTHAWWEPLVQMTLILGHFWRVRGYTASRDQFTALALTAAESINDQTAMIKLRCSLIRMLVEQNKLRDAAVMLESTQRERDQLLEIDPIVDDRLGVERITLLIQCEKYQEALQAAQDLVALSEKRGWRWAVVNRYYIPESLYHLGRYAEARECFLAIIPRSEAEGYLRAAITGWILLARIALQAQDPGDAEQYLALAYDRASQLSHERNLAEIHQCEAHVALFKGNQTTARTSLAQAIDLFERLGMRRELAEAREELRRLDEIGEAPAA